MRGVDILTVLQSFILGIIQGLTEFLPISSSGHLVLFQKLFGLEQGVVTFDIAVHLATLIGVFVVLRKDILNILKKPLGKLPLLIVAGTIPAVIFGIVFSDLINGLFQSGISLGFEFILTGLVLWYAESLKSSNKGLDRMTLMDAVVIGTAQSIAILPAISRSGLTIAGSLFRGLNREFALKFSFLLSIPAILGAAAKDIYDISGSASGSSISIGFWPLLTGVVTSAILGYLTVRFMLKVFSKISLKIFSYYVFAVGILILIDQIFFGRFFMKLF